MANVYVRSGAGGAATGADWANAYLTLGAACAAKAAGDVFWVSEDHAESTAGAVTIACPGTVGTPCQILCVDHTGTVPPVAADLRTTATISTTGANALTMNGFFYCYGIIFQSAASGGAVAANMTLGGVATNHQDYESCIFRLLGTTASFLIVAGINSGSVVLNNCSTKFAAVGSGLLPQANFTWRNSPTAVDAAGSLPTTFITQNAAGLLYWEGVDLSALSGKTIFGNSSKPQKLILKDCKLPASVTIAAAQTGGLGGGEVYVIRSDSGATNYRDEIYNYAGVLTTETTIVRTGGASDGTTPVAKKIITTANSRWADPFSFPLSVWNDVSGSSVTVTVYGIWGGGAVPKNDEIWIDVQYPGSALTPQGSKATSTKATILTTNADVATDSSTWGGSTTAFKLVAAFTPQMKGPLTVYVRCAKASTTFYVDPKPVLS